MLGAGPSDSGPEVDVSMTVDPLDVVPPREHTGESEPGDEDPGDTEGEILDLMMMSLCRLNQDKCRRWGYMMTNISECINVVLEGTWFLPNSAIIRAKYERLQQLWVRKDREAHAQLAARATGSQCLLTTIVESRYSIHACHTLQSKKLSVPCG
ncbi:hypothetical protein PIB30_004694 [Stylosanthes scabra]|uniref:Uncharacterized protein n=1 Tax=Stylosanthes scabra TaxID=79078 RepID=A0ABU6R2M7_9FABA|nr:hypothetical protein [Stylosanthes scabra]